MSEIILNHSDKSITIKNLVIKNDDLFAFLEAHPDHEEAVRKAIVVGALGIRSMGTDVKMDYVDKKFAEFMSDIKQKFDEQHMNVQNLIVETFDEENVQSPMFKFAKNLETYFNDKTGVVRNIINDTFDLANKKSPIGALAQNLDLYFNDTGTVKKMLDSHFDLNARDSSMSQFVDKLSENFDVDKGTIRKLLNPSEQGMPVYLLKEELMRNINDLREKMVATKAEQTILDKSTQKGGVFEDFVYELLHDITNAHGDTIENTKSKIGRMADRKVGDFVVHMKDGDERIVVEAKDSVKHSIPEVLEEIRDSIENRDAKFGIFLFKTVDQMPQKLRPCRIERNYIVTSADGGGLYYAYHVARTIIGSGRTQKGGTIPVDKIQAEVEHLVKKNLIIDEAIKKARKITEHVDSVESTLRLLQSEIDESLHRIQSLLKNN
ncbi:MAG TPA: hypothetical protein VJI12_02060 [archaeon]|nr:hypothetical protein [archaeon]